MGEYVLELQDITKVFPGVTALDHVSFNLKKGEIHALMGENGAGKSTFIKVITGVHIPEQGRIYVNGEEKIFQSPTDAQACKIAAIYQHVTCYPDLTVTENIFMGHEIHKKTGMIHWKEMHRISDELLKSLGADFEGKTLMGSLSVARQQIVEIAKALSADAEIIIMDEPTAALTKRESEELYQITEQLKKNGKAIIFISHRFEDMYRLADRVTVFRDARYIGTWDKEEVNDDMLIMAMVGREITNLFPNRNPRVKEELLRIENFSRAGLFADIHLQVHAGEIVGLTGLVGAGRTEVCQSIFGILPHDTGELYYMGKKFSVRHPFEALRTGIAYLPEDRQKQGLILKWSIGRNITLPILNRTSRHGWTSDCRERSRAEQLFRELNIKATGIDDLADSLSGGNQQKVIVAKLLALDLKLLILDEPTKGVDVGAKNAMYEIMNNLAEQGFGILLVSSEMQEVLSLCDRILVMKEGRIRGELNGQEATQEKILALAMASAAEGSE